MSTTGYNEPVVNAPLRAEGAPITDSNVDYDNTTGEGNEVRHTDDTVYTDKEGRSKKEVARGYLMYDLPLIFLRFLQFACSVIVLGLLAYVLKGYSFHGSKKTNYSLATSVISVFYLLMIAVVTSALARYLLPGVYVILELVITILWFCAFVVLAKAHGSFSCGLKHTTTFNSNYGSYSSFQSSGGYYDPFTDQYTTRNFGRPCRSADAAIAFSGVTFVLFAISSILIGVYVLRPVLSTGGSKGIWKPFSSYGYRLNRITGLNLVEESNRQNDVEGVGHDQRTFSTGGSTYNGTHQEKFAAGHQRNMSGTTDMADPVVAVPLVNTVDPNVDVATGPNTEIRPVTATQI